MTDLSSPNRTADPVFFAPLNFSILLILPISLSWLARLTLKDVDRYPTFCFRT
jgi:hypothetical protein